MSTDQGSAPRALPDRSVRLMVAGIFEILMGCFCLLLAMILGGALAAQIKLQAPSAQGLSAAGMVPALLFYILAAVAFVWVGIGLAGARRWAWALTVVWSWVWLVIGAFAFTMVSCFMRERTWTAIADQGKLPPQMVATMQITTTVMLGCIYLVVPGLFLVLCHHKSVRATCERRDRKTRWTDRCPLPVLALSLILALSVISMFSMAAYHWTFPIFGVYVSGATGAALVVLIAAVLAYLAWGTYRLQPAAWWGALVMIVVGTANMVVVFAAMDLSEMYKKMGMPADQIELMQKAGILEMLTRWGPTLGAVGAIGWLGYLLFLRRYFFGSRASSPMGEAS